MGVDHFLNLQPGTVINERYEIVKCLGAGSMGMVYACRHKELAGHMVAMKVLYSEVARDEVAAARFKNEIFASYNVSHPNVVRAYEYFTDGDLTAFTMEFIGGGDLADRLESAEPIPIEEIVDMLCQMTSGLQAIHLAGIIHRDIKPENILITAKGDVKITDFGIARNVSGPRLTEHGGVVGTIDYVSPEYLEKNQVDERSDIYSLSILAYEMLTLESPFQGKSLIDTMQMRLRQDAVPPIDLRDDCPPLLNDIVMKAMARSPEQRYQSASELLVDLDQTKNMLESGEDGLEYQEEKQEPSVPSIEKDFETPRVTVEDDRKSESKATRDIRSVLEDSSKKTDEEYSSFQEFASAAKAKSGEFKFEQQKEPAEDPAVISVSRGALRTDRVRELSSQQNISKKFSLKSFILWLFVLFIWMGLVFSVLKYYKPELFGGKPHTGSRSGSDWGESRVITRE